MSTQLQDPYSYEYGTYATTVHETEYSDALSILGPNGQPLKRRPRTPLGFDLSPRTHSQPAQSK